MNFSEALYRYSPVWLQNLGITLYGLHWRWRRFGPGFEDALRAVQAREGYTSDQWRWFQTQKLRELLHAAVTTVPYYRDTYLGLGLSPEDFRNFQLEDLPRLPLVSKQDIRPNPNRFVSSKAGRLYAYFTSGSTGTPLKVFMSARTQRRWQALYEARCRRWAGVDHRMRRAMIGGRLVVPTGAAKPPFWRVNLAEKQLYLSAFHISPETTKDYLEALRRFKPDYLVGYASAWFFLARFAREQGLRGPRVKAILTSSEALSPTMRETMEAVFGSPVFDAYSGVEACCLASECSQHRLHLSPDAGIVELVKEDGSFAQPGEAGEIVATGLVNFDQPLIRYRTGDLAVLSPEPCPCGRSMPVLKDLEGRLEDVVIGPDGRETVRFHGLALALSGIVEAQVVQPSLQEIEVRVVAEATFGPKQEKALQERVRVRLGEVRVTVRRVPFLERSPAGKVRAVISHVKRSGT